jgi:hypothetical protein
LGVAAALACLSATLLSLTMETLQNYLPHRVSSNVDLALNALGTAIGVAIGAALHWRGGIARWQKVRDRWFVARSAGGLALLILWPVGLLFPTAVPFARPRGRPIQPIVVELLADTPAAAWTEGWATATAPSARAAAAALSPAPSSRSSSSAFCSRRAWSRSRSRRRTAGVARSSRSAQH